MLYGPDGKPVTVTTRTVEGAEPPPPKPKMHKCLWCGRRSRLGTYCCNPRYREDSKFNAETKKQKLDRLELEKQSKEARDEIRATGL